MLHPLNLLSLAPAIALPLNAKAARLPRIPYTRMLLRIPQLAFYDNRSFIPFSMTNVTSKKFLFAFCLDVQIVDLVLAGLV